MSIIETKAREIEALLSVQEGVAAAGERPIIEWLIENFAKLLPLILGCLPMAQRNAAGLAKALNTPNLRMRLGLHFYLARNIDDPRTGNFTVSEVKAAAYKMAEGCNETDATALLAEVA